jgi:hypothetical protein
MPPILLLNGCIKIPHPDQRIATGRQQCLTIGTEDNAIDDSLLDPPRQHLSLQVADHQGTIQARCRKQPAIRAEGWRPQQWCKSPGTPTPA